MAPGELGPHNAVFAGEEPAAFTDWGDVAPASTRFFDRRFSTGYPERYRMARDIVNWGEGQTIENGEKVVRRTATEDTAEEWRVGGSPCRDATPCGRPPAPEDPAPCGPRPSDGRPEDRANVQRRLP